MCTYVCRADGTSVSLRWTPIGGKGDTLYYFGSGDTRPTPTPNPTPNPNPNQARALMEEGEGLQGGRSLEEAPQHVRPTPPQKSTRPQSACAACPACPACAACGLCGLCDLQPVRHVRHAACAACGMGGLGSLGGWFGPASARRLCAASPAQPPSRPAAQPLSRPPDDRRRRRS